jgi:hypothetical protein
MENGISQKETLSSEINSAIQDIAQQKEIEGIKSLSRYDPQKVAKILYLFSTGVSQTSMVRKYGIDRETIINTLVDYADYKNKFRELGGKLSAKNYINMTSLSEDLVDNIRNRVESGDIEPSIRDLKDLSIAMANASREALTARGEVSSISEERKVHTQDDYIDTKKAVEARLREIKEAEIIEEE